MPANTTRTAFLIDSYLTFCRVEGRTPKTVEWHENALNELATFLTGQGIEELTDVTRNVLREYVSYLQTKPSRTNTPLSPHTVATYVRSLRTFFRWLHVEEYLDTNPAERISEPKAGERDIETLTAEQIRALCAVCTGPNAQRDRAIVLTLYDTGLRANELTSARLEDFTDMPASIRVLGKGRKYRTVPLGRNATKEVRRYLRARKDESPYLFVSRSGTQLTPNGLFQLLKRRGELAGVPCHPHLFRHTFAISYLRNGGDVFSLQRILGHSTLEMVRHYARLADSDVTERHREFSPADKLKVRG